MSEPYLHWTPYCIWDKSYPLLQKQVRQNITDIKRDKLLRDGDPSWRGSFKRGDVSTKEEALTHRCQLGAWDHRGQDNWEEGVGKQKL